MNPYPFRFAVTGLLSIVLTAVGISPALAQSTLTPEQLSIRVERLTQSSKTSEATLGSMQQDLKNLADDMARMGRLIDNRAMLEMLQRVDLLSEEVSQLTGEFEQQGHDIEEVKKRQRELYLDIDRRLRDLESRAPGQAPAALQTIPKLPTPSLPETDLSAGSQSDVGEMETATLSSQQTQVPSVTQSEEKAAYQAAFDTLKEGRYKKAKTELSTFLERYPDSSFAGNAQYWLGEAHYVTRNFEQGITEFEKVLSQYSNSSKVPDAMLKLGYTYYELKQFDLSKTILQQLHEQFDKTTAARLAVKRLDRIRKEGH